MRNLVELVCPVCPSRIRIKSVTDLQAKITCCQRTPGQELSFCSNLWFFNPYIFATLCRRPLIFQTVNSVRWNSLCLKYQRFTLSGAAKIWGLENLNLWQKLSSFVPKFEHTESTIIRPFCSLFQSKFL